MMVEYERLIADDWEFVMNNDAWIILIIINHGNSHKPILMMVNHHFNKNQPLLDIISAVLNHCPIW